MLCHARALPRLLRRPPPPQLLLLLSLSRRGVGGTRVAGAADGVEADGVHRYAESRVLPFGAEHCWRVVAAVQHYPLFVPWCTRAAVLSAPAPGEAGDMRAELCVGFGPLAETFESKVALQPFETVSARSTDTRLLKHLDTRWRFTPMVGDAAASDELEEAALRTRVSFEIEFQFSSALYHRLSDIFMEEVAKRMVSAFEERCAVVDAQIKRQKRRKQQWQAGEPALAVSS